MFFARIARAWKAHAGPSAYDAYSWTTSICAALKNFAPIVNLPNGDAVCVFWAPYQRGARVEVRRGENLVADVTFVRTYGGVHPVLNAPGATRAETKAILREAFEAIEAALAVAKAAP